MCKFANTVSLQKVSFDPIRETTVGPPVPVTPAPRTVRLPDLSPDGGWIAFYTLGKQEDVFLIRTDGAGLRQLTDDDHMDRAPRWSPDGRSIAWMSARSGKFEIWTMNPDGGGVRQLTHDSRGPTLSPLWSPDGTRLAYTVHGLGPFIIDVGEAMAGTVSRALWLQLNEPGAWFWARSWSPDGRSIAGDLQGPEGTYSGIGVYSLRTRAISATNEDSAPSPAGWLTAAG